MTDSDDWAPTWPVDLDGIIETVVTTRRPNGRWNVAALGLSTGDPVTARTWGDTRTRRNFHREGEGVVQFVDDPVAFVEAALDVREEDDPVLADAAAWVRVAVESLATGEDDGTTWENWALEPVASDIRRRTVPTIDRGFNAVVEATIVASRLGVPAYDDTVLRERLAFFEETAHRCGGERERKAISRLRDLMER